jgi:putative transcriptional regulator
VSKVGEKILMALREFGDALESGEPLEKRFTIRSYVLPAEPTQYDGPAVQAVRERYAMSQGVFAKFLCVSSATVQSWEQGRRVPSPIARRLLDEMSASPEHFLARFARLTAPTSSQSLSPTTTRRVGNAGKGGSGSAKRPRIKTS